MGEGEEKERKQASDILPGEEDVVVIPTLGGGDESGWGGPRLTCLWGLEDVLQEVSAQGHGSSSLLLASDQTRRRAGDQMPSWPPAGLRSPRGEAQHTSPSEASPSTLLPHVLLSVSPDGESVETRS